MQLKKKIRNPQFELHSALKHAKKKNTSGKKIKKPTNQNVIDSKTRVYLAKLK